MRDPYNKQAFIKLKGNLLPIFSGEFVAADISIAKAAIFTSRRFQDNLIK